MKSSKTIWAVNIICGLFILLFAYTGITKLLQHEQFVFAMKQSPLLSEWSETLSVVIPVLELLVSILLFIPRHFSRVAGLAASFMLMFWFTLYLLYMLLFTSDLPCSCGGVISGMTWTQHLVFNIIFTLLAAIGLIYSFDHKLFIAIDRQSRNPV